MPVDSQPRKEPPKLLVPVKGDRKWSTGLFSCGLECGKCLLVTCCLPCMLAKMAEKLHECCAMPCCAGPGMRTKIRTMVGIKGTICEDCYTMMCCAPCAVCQMVREMDELKM